MTEVTTEALSLDEIERQENELKIQQAIAAFQRTPSGMAYYIEAKLFINSKGKFDPGIWSLSVNGKDAGPYTIAGIMNVISQLGRPTYADHWFASRGLPIPTEEHRNYSSLS